MATQEDLKSALQSELDRLVALRDELRVQLKLATAEAREEWDRLETAWERVHDEVTRIREETKEPVHQLSHASAELLNQVKQGYARIRAGLK